jgi:hypothetical protein
MATYLHWGDQSIALASESDVDQLKAEIMHAATAGGSWVTVDAKTKPLEIFVVAGQYISLSERAKGGRGA